MFDESTWDLLRIHDDGDDGGDDDEDVLAEGVSSHFVCTATRCRTNKSDEQTCKTNDMRWHANGSTIRYSCVTVKSSRLYRD